MNMIIFVIICIILMLILILYFILKSPFSYPYFIHQFDVSGKRQPVIEDYLDMFLISSGFTEIQAHQKVIEQWKIDCSKWVENSILKKYRNKQYIKSIDDMKAYQFSFIRYQTRYSQRNYVKSSYKVNVQTGHFIYDYDYIANRYKQLSNIGFECTLRQYYTKKQRKLMTQELRKEIMQRDNYTCQICGKYMPDEVGLQIDHIIPVSKGGKTVRSNLRVLCSKCNGSKSDKL